jgi:hypothetical protein
LQFTFTHGSNLVIGTEGTTVAVVGIAIAIAFVKRTTVLKTANKAIVIFVSTIAKFSLLQEKTKRTD